MRLRTLFFAVSMVLSVWSALFAFQRGGFRRGDDGEPLVTPEDAGEKTEWAFARLQYPSNRRRRGGMDNNWTIDYPKADRQFAQGVRRLTRLHTRSVEEVVNLEADQVYNWPWLYVVEVVHWVLNDEPWREVRD